MGRVRPPLYKLEEVMEIIDKISIVDEKINELLIQREVYVKDLKQKIKASANSEDKD